MQWQIKVMLVLMGFLLIVLPVLCLFPGMPVWYGVCLLLAQFSGFAMVILPLAID